jgi:serine/threonine protein kinase
MNYCLNPYCKNPQNPDHVTVCLSCNSDIILDNRYRPIQFLGGGGQGRNFLAIDEKTPTKKRCVIKQFCPHPNIADDTRNLQKATELFNREATVLDELGDESPQIPRLLAHLEQDKRLYLVQEFIDGENLLNELAQNGNFSEAKINYFLNEFLPVLRFIHQRGVIHRDIKPENIMRRKDGLLVLIDFGLSKQMSGTIMVMGTVGGTMGYAPAEQLIYGEAYFASDIYALGATCIHLLTGIPPHQLFNPREKRWLWEDILSQRGEGVSKYLSQILNKMLMLDVDDRYQNVDEILQVLKVDTYPLGRNIQHQQQNIFQKIFNISPVNCIQTINSGVVNYVKFFSKNSVLVGDNKLYNWNTGALVQELKYSNFAYHPNENLIVRMDEKANIIEIIEIETGKVVNLFNTPPDIDSHLVTTQYNFINHDGRFLVFLKNFLTNPDFQLLRILDLNLGSIFSSFISFHYGFCNSDIFEKFVSKLDKKFFHNPVCLSFSPDNQKIAFTYFRNNGYKRGDDLGILIGDIYNEDNLITWSLNSAIKDEIHFIKSLSFNPQGDILASAGWDTNIKLWNPHNGQLIRTLTGHKDAVNSIAFSPDGQILASGSNDKTIKLWEVNTGKEICTLKGHTGFINSIAFSPDGQVLASGSNDKTIKIWRWN